MRHTAWLGSLLLATAAFGWLCDPDTLTGRIVDDANPDGHVFASGTEAVATLLGEAHKGGMDLAGANAKGVTYTVSVWWDRNRDGAADADDETGRQTVLTDGVSDAATTLPVASTAGFGARGFVRIGDEVAYYGSRTATAFTEVERGYVGTTAAAHLAGAAATEIGAWWPVAQVTCDGSPDDAVGWDGTSGNLLASSGATWDADSPVPPADGRHFLAKIRVVDSGGATTTEVGGVDVFERYGPDSYLDADGDAAQGLDADEVLQLRINAPPRRRW